jgi:hypothetical protein
MAPFYNVIAGCSIRRRGIAMCIPPKRRPKNWKAKRGRPVVARKDEFRLRYKVERSFAWLGNCRRLLIRWERLLPVYRGFFALALARVCLRRLFPAISSQCAAM